MGKIGIMGGTFDPIHNGHLLLGKQAYEEYGLDQVWYMPSGQPPHKKNHKITDADKRCDMVKLAIEEFSWCKFTDFEIKRTGDIYTAQTLALLKQTYPLHSFYFIVGADSLYEIETWYHPKQVMDLAILLVAGREYEEAGCSVDEQISYLEQKYKARIFQLHCRQVDISSAEIRKMVENRKSVESYVPQKVENYMKAHNLYQEDGL